MITASLIFLLIWVLQALALVLNAFAFAIPTQINEYMQFVIGHARYLKGIFPIGDLLLAISWVLSSYLIIKIVQITYWLFSHIPFIKWGHLRDLKSSKEVKVEHKYLKN